MTTDLRDCVSDALALTAASGDPTGFPAPFLGMIVHNPSQTPTRCEPARPHAHLKMLWVFPPQRHSDQPDGVLDPDLAHLTAQLHRPDAITNIHNSLPAIPAGFRTASWAMYWNSTDPQVVCQTLAVDTDDHLYRLHLDTNHIIHGAISTLQDAPSFLRNSLTIQTLRALVGHSR